MIKPDIEQALPALLGRLEIDQQQQVLAFARSVAEQRAAGVSGEIYRAFAGMVPPEGVAEMKQAIEEGCERLDACLIRTLSSRSLRKRRLS
jgi:hypothetical protein